MPRFPSQESTLARDMTGGINILLLTSFHFFLEFLIPPSISPFVFPSDAACVLKGRFFHGALVEVRRGFSRARLINGHRRAICEMKMIIMMNCQRFLLTFSRAHHLLSLSCLSPLLLPPRKIFGFP